jgi:hypothetical protein
MKKTGLLNETRKELEYEMKLERNWNIRKELEYEMKLENNWNMK